MSDAPTTLGPTTPGPTTLGELAELVRSKNAGPFWITFDVFLASDRDYQRVAAPGVITESAIAELYHVDPSDVRVYRLSDLRAVKISFPRPTAQGTFGDRDMHAGQQHLPLTTLTLP
jgi:hypothetical protein